MAAAQRYRPWRPVAVGYPAHTGAGQHNQGSHELARFITEVCTGLDMDSIEGRSRFISIVQSQWERLPKSAFKSQLLGEIAALAELNEPELITLWGASSHIGFRDIDLRKKK